VKEPKNKQIIIRVTTQMHKDIKMLSVETGKSINDYIVSYFAELLKKKGDKK